MMGPRAQPPRLLRVRGFLMIACVVSVVVASATVRTAAATTVCAATAALDDNTYHNVTVVAAGASLPFRVYTLTTMAYSVATGAGAVLYDSTGSGTGKARLISNVVDWAGTDSVFDAAAYSSTPDLQLLPALAAAVVPVVNLPSVGGGRVTLSKQVLARVFLGTVSWWNDTSITALNAGLTLPRARIAVIVREDKSGSTSIFTEGLSLFDSGFNTTIGHSSEPAWNYASRPVPVTAASGTSGVAGAMLTTPNSITYVSSDSATALSLSQVCLATGVGNSCITASQSAIQAAQLEVGDAFTSRFTASLVSDSNPKAYPLASYTYIAVRKDTDRDGCVVRAAALEYLVWFFTSQVVSGIISDAGFSPLLPATSARALDVLGQGMQCQGTPLRPTESSTLVGRGSSGVAEAMALFAHVWASEQQPAVTLDFAANRTLPPSAVFALFPSNEDAGGIKVPAGWLSAPVAVERAHLVVNLEIGGAAVALTLDVATLAKILLGDVAFFDDAAVAALNPGVALPHTPIVWVAASPRSDCVAVLGAVVASESESFATAFAQTSWPRSQLGDRFTEVATQGQVPVVGASVDGALWCTAVSVNLGKEVTLSGVAAPASADEVCSGAATAGPTLSVCMSLHLRQQFAGNADCRLGRNAVNFVAFMFAGGQRTLSAAGMEPLGDALRAAGVDAIASATCDGVSILRPPVACTFSDMLPTVGECGFDATALVSFVIDPASPCLRNAPGAAAVPPSLTIECGFVPFSSAYALAAYAAVTIVVLLLLLVVVWVRANSGEQRIKYSQPLFCFMYASGGIVMVLVMLSFLGQNDEATCRLRPVLFNLAFSAMFVPLHLKSYRVYRIFDNPSLKRVLIRNSDLVRRILIILGLESLFLLGWCLASDFTSVDNVTVLVGVRPVQQTVCSSSLVEFPTAVFAWKAVQLGTGLFFAAKTWNVSSLYSEARPFGLAIGNIAFVGLVTAGITLLLPLAASWRVLIQVFATCYGVATSQMAVFAPKYIAVRQHRRTAGGTTSINPLVTTSQSHRALTKTPIVHTRPTSRSTLVRQSTPTHAGPGATRTTSNALPPVRGSATELELQEHNQL